jgi:hypothetical protein
VKNVTLTFLVGVALASAISAATLWKDPGPVTSLDLRHGVGGAEMVPQPPFLFQEEVPGGTSPKIRVTDANKRVWTVKFGPEAKAEVLASRLAWAAGYFAEPMYFVKEATLENVAKLTRAEPFVDRSNQNRIRDARFELFDPLLYKFQPRSSWTFETKGLGDANQLAGLRLLMMLVSNWDIKPENTAIVTMNGEPYYAFTDWGATMGRWGDITGRSKWDCSGYAKQSEKFVDEVDGGYVHFNYEGKKTSQTARNIKVENVRWFVDRMGALTDDQLRAAAEAAGATPDESVCFVNGIRSRLNQLKTVAEGGDNPGTVTRTRTVTKTKTVQVQ